MQELDTEGNVPLLCMDVFGLANMPKFGVKELSEVAIAQKILQLELMILQLVSTVDQHADILFDKQSAERCISPKRHSTTRHTQTVHSPAALSVLAANVKDNI